MENSVKKLYNTLIKIKEDLENENVIKFEFNRKELIEYLLNLEIDSVEKFVNEALEDCEEIPYVVDLINKEFILIVRCCNNYCYEITIDLKKSKIKDIKIINEDKDIDMYDFYDFIIISGIYLKYLFNQHELKEYLLDTIRGLFD